MVLKLPNKIYISSANVDMRKSIDGLAAIVQCNFSLDPMSDSMYVFHNKNCDKVKILYWDTEGFCLLYKRLEREKFRFPKHINEPIYTVTKEEVLWLIHGLRIEEIKKYHKIMNEIADS
jgi:transposase